MLSYIMIALKFCKKNYKLLFVLYAITATAIALGMYYKYTQEKEESQRLENNQEALMSDIEEYKTKSGKNAAKVKELEMTASEFKKLCSEQAETLKDMGVKVSRLQNMSTTATETNIVANTILRDTVIKTVVDSVIVVDSVKYFSWNDPWNKIYGQIKGKDVKCGYQGVDTLTIAASRVPKKFLFFKWGTKSIQVNVSNKNTSSHITWNRTIKIK